MSARMDVYLDLQLPMKAINKNTFFRHLHEVISENNTMGYQMRCKAGREQNVHR